MMTLVPAISTLWKREILKFTRDRSRLIGALVQPLAFWILLGLGFHQTFQVPAGGPVELSYLEYLFPGIIAMILLFTAIFSTISVVEERKSGFLQAALVAPVPRIGLVLGHLLGGTTLAVVEALLFVLLLPLLGLTPTLPGLLVILLVSILTGIAFTGLGFVIAWRMDSTRGFHAVMNLFLLPLWFLSGAPFPIGGASPLLQWIMYINPVSYAVSALRQAIYLPGADPVPLAPLWVCLLVTALFSGLLVLLALYTIRRPLFASGTRARS